MTQREWQSQSELGRGITEGRHRKRVACSSEGRRDSGCSHGAWWGTLCWRIWRSPVPAARSMPARKIGPWIAATCRTSPSTSRRRSFRAACYEGGGPIALVHDVASREIRVHGRRKDSGMSNLDYTALGLSCFGPASFLKAPIVGPFGDWTAEVAYL